MTLLLEDCQSFARTSAQETYKTSKMKTPSFPQNTICAKSCLLDSDVQRAKTMGQYIELNNVQIPTSKRQLRGS